MTDRVFVASWDMYGLESIIDATELEQREFWNTLADKPTSNELGRTITIMTMRARHNTHRHYEIYSFVVAESITREDIIAQFNEAPQAMAELIREKGNKIYSDRMKNELVKIV